MRTIRIVSALLTSIMAFGVMLGACASTPTPFQGQPPIKATKQATITATAPSSAQVQRSAPSSTPEICTDKEGILLSEDYRLSADYGIAPVNIYLPPCYERIDEDLPIIYFLHGYPQNEEHWIDLGVIESYEKLLLEGRLDAMILVFPRQPEPFFTQSDGGPGSFEEILLDHLVVAVEQRVRASNVPEERAILGVSRGGVWALEIGLRHPEVFDIIAALSPALAYNHPRPAYDPFVIVRSVDELPSNILISVGDREPQFAVEIERFAGQLGDSGIEFEYLQHEGRHEDEAWRGIINPVLLFVGDAVHTNRTLVLD